MKKELDIDFRKCVDDLGRVVIPKELRNRFNIKDGDNLKINYCEDTITIEKIKPKTLMEQLKEQGFGWELGKSGIVRKVPLASMMVDSFEYDRAKQGNCFLTESEAEREAYRRKLEFEMQEWARERDCLGNILNYYPWRDFRVSLKGTEEFKKVFESVFSEKVDKYYDWEV